MDEDVEKFNPRLEALRMWQHQCVEMLYKKIGMDNIFSRDPKYIDYSDLWDELSYEIRVII